MGKNIKRLCFGTFASVLVLCKAEDISQSVLVETVIRTVDPQSVFTQPEHAATVTRLLKCERNFPNVQRQREAGNETNRLSSVPSCAREAKKEDVSARFAENVLPLLDEEKKALAVLALLDIIESDVELDGSKRASFNKYFGTTKSALLGQSVFVLHDFLAMAFLYSSIAVKNEVGAECIHLIDENYVGSFRDNIDEIRLADSTTLTGPVAEQILTIFNDAIKECHIVEYMDCDPAVALPKILADYLEKFLDAINRNIIIGLIEYQKEEAYRKVSNFTDALLSYYRYLTENLYPKTDVFALTGTEEADYVSDFNRTVNEHKWRIDSIYGEINNGNTLFVL
ncbi:hypothetical protein LJC32_02170 [Oscillospiraceae bacterium OttesenSCG-928-F05]|nr:hypothetical protein [Oscillospiraceae bacterium OttesenSCG-928-F05]